MLYEPHLSDEAAAKFKTWPVHVQEAVAERILEICKSPNKNSRSACFPYFPRGHVSILQIPFGSKKTRVISIHFQFGQDEKTIEIASFGTYILSAEEQEDIDPFSG
jgi:hypothetical protein